MSESPGASGFFGRTDELAAFERAVAAARAGSPAVLLISGDAGIGKTTLVREATQRTGAPLVVGRCLPMGGEVIPLAPLAELRRAVARTKPDVLAASPSLRDWATDGSTIAGTTAGALFAPVLEMVAALGAADVVVVAVEDLHWADPLTWDLFDYLARNLVDEHVVLVGTYRDNEVGADPHARRRVGELARIPSSTRVSLSGLSREELAAKIEFLTGYVPRAAFVDEMLLRGQGNPFFTGELVKAQREGESFPAVLSDLIGSELGALDDTARAVANALAVVGRDASHDLVARIVDVDDATLEAGLRAAIDARLVVVDRHNESYRFRHALIGEVLYDELLPSERKRLHHRVADALAALSPDVLARADSVGEYAFHLDRAGDAPAAFTALLRAADAAESLAPATALRHLQRALELWDAAGEVAATEDRGDRLWQTAELASGTLGNETAARIAQDAFTHGTPVRGEAWGHERLGRYLWGAGLLDESTAEYAKAEALLGNDASADAVRVFAGLGQGELMLGHYDRAETHAQQVFELLEHSDDDPGAWVMARRVLGMAIGHAGNPARGLALCREAVERAPNAQTRMRALLYFAAALMDAGEYQDAANEMLDGAVEARLTGLDGSFAGYIDALAVEALARLGRHDEAANVFEHTQGADAFPIGRARLAIAGAWSTARRGDRDRALALLAEADALPLDPFHRWYLDRATAEASIVLGLWADAAAVAERVLATEPLSLWRARFVMYSAIAAVELALDARARREPFDADAVTARLLQTIKDAQKAAEAGAGEGEALDTSAHLAHAAATVTRLGDPDPDAWAEARRRWAQLGDPYWIGIAAAREAEAAAARGDAARAADALRQAHELAVNIGAVPLANEIEAIGQRTRISVDAPVVVALGSNEINQLGLTPREAEVLSLVAAGLTNRQIGESLFVSEKTASVHVSNILRKLAVNTRVEAAAVAQRLGLN
jgi:DNA-binding NarL/FixJ family response regulator